MSEPSLAFSSLARKQVALTALSSFDLTFCSDLESLCCPSARFNLRHLSLLAMNSR